MFPQPGKDLAARGPTLCCSDSAGRGPLGPSLSGFPGASQHPELHGPSWALLCVELPSNPLALQSSSSAFPKQLENNFFQPESQLCLF